MAEHFKTRFGIRYWHGKYVAWLAGFTRPSTVRREDAIIEDFFNFFPEKHKVTQFTTPEVVDFIRHQQLKGRSDMRIQRDLSSVKRFFKYLIDEAHIDILNPVIKPKPTNRKVEQAVYDALTYEEAQKLLAVHREKFFSLTYWMFWFSTGLNVEEMCRLCWRDVDLEQQIITVPGSNFVSARVVPLCPEMIWRLRKIREAPDNFVCRNWMLNSRAPKVPAMRLKWRKALKKAGLPPRRVDSIRHLLRTWLIRRGIPLEQVERMLALRSPSRRLRARFGEDIPLEAVRREQQALLGLPYPDNWQPASEPPQKSDPATPTPEQAPESPDTSANALPIQSFHQNPETN